MILPSFFKKKYLCLASQRNFSIKRQHSLYRAQFSNETTVQPWYNLSGTFSLSKSSMQRLINHLLKHTCSETIRIALRIALRRLHRQMYTMHSGSNITPLLVDNTIFSQEDSWLLRSFLFSFLCSCGLSRVSNPAYVFTNRWVLERYAWKNCQKTNNISISFLQDIFMQLRVPVRSYKNRVKARESLKYRLIDPFSHSRLTESMVMIGRDIRNSKRYALHVYLYMVLKSIYLGKHSSVISAQQASANIALQNRRLIRSSYREFQRYRRGRFLQM